jgi:transposase-like protein
MSDYLLDNPQKIGGPGKTVEIDESKFGKRKCNRGHHVEGQWIFGGVERGTGRSFFVPVENRTQRTLMDTILTWIEPETRIISDCWAVYNDLDRQGYTHQTVKHGIGFVDPTTGANTHTIKSYWRHLEVYVDPFSRKKGCQCDQAQNMFTARCKADNVDPFTVFLHVAATTDWRH